MYQLKTDKTIQAEDHKLVFSVKEFSFQHFISLIMSLIIALVSVVIKVVIKLLSKFECAQSFTELQFRITKKLWKMEFINMAIVPFLISVSMLNFFDIGGLLEEIRIIFLVNAILPHLVNLVLDFEWYFILAR